MQMRDLLRYVVTDGTGKKADIPGYDVGGKTGSAQVPGPHGRYIPHALRTIFLRRLPGAQSALSGVRPAGPAAWHQGDRRLRSGRLDGGARSRAG